MCIDVHLVGAHGTLLSRRSYGPGVVWAPYSFSLDESGVWRRMDPRRRYPAVDFGHEPSGEDEIVDVLSTLKAIRIRVASSMGRVGAPELDNVTLSGPREDSGR